MLDTDLLRSFLTIAETGSFTVAARKLGRTQSAISMQIKRLEDSVGRPVFDRSARSIRLTTAGETLRDYADRILRLQAEAEAVIKRPEIEGTVRLGTPDDYAACFLPPILVAFARSYPRVHVEVMCQTSNALVGQLEQGNLDLAIVTRQPGLPKGELLRREGLVWASSDSHSVQAQDTVPLALWQPDCIFRRSALEALDRSGRPWRVTYTSESLAGLQAIVGAGLAVTVLIRDTVPAHFRILGEAEGFPPLPSVEIAMLRGRGQQSEAAAVLERHIVDFLRRPEGEAEQPLLAAAE